MIEVKKLSKTYKTKKGVQVKALDNVNISFEEKGLVFILGKSGSGKSTLLNMIGGLDSFDNGEIVVKGKSSKDFSRSDFDSYRNTFIGFIFQEYNILNEFTVGANIALAMELQGRKSSNDQLSKILKEVDLEGFGTRKPNELSGGQKQRVAIARALIKNPEIILADEPTGALDSNSGIQVFDTLKRLSKDKLVIVVSHDREFAQLYGDRVIELADGRIISDIKKIVSKPKSISDGISMVDENIIHIHQGYILSESDMELIKEYIKNNSNNDTFISLDKKTNSEIKKVARIDESGQRENFIDVTNDNITIPKYDESAFKLIKSKLPLKNSLKMAFSSLRKKPFRLLITVLLATVAFTLFGLANTMSSFDKVESNVDSIIDTKVDYISFVKEKNYIYSDYDFTNKVMLSDNDIKTIETKYPENNFAKLYSPITSSLNLNKNIFNRELLSSDGESPYYCTILSGITTVSGKYVDDMGYGLQGNLPNKENEIAITKFTAQTFITAGYASEDAIDRNDIKNKTEIKSEKDLIGKKLTLNLGLGEKEYLVTGIVDTKFDTTRYEILKDNKGDKSGIGYYMLYSEMNEVCNNNLNIALFVSKDTFNKSLENNKEISFYQDNSYLSFKSKEDIFSVDYLLKSKDVNEKYKSQIVMLKDKKIEELEENEIIIPISFLANLNTEFENIFASEDKDTVLNTIKDKEDEISKNLFSLLVYEYHGETQGEINIPLKIAGIYLNNNENSKFTAIVNEALVNKINIDTSGIYKSIVGKMPKERNEIKDIVKYSYEYDENNSRYCLSNSITDSIRTISSVINGARQVLLYIGIGFAIFAGIMLMNFIATSITNKKREIGILRAVGARGNDVFGIFFNESIIIAIINWIVSVIVSGSAVYFINTAFRTKYNFLVTILHFGILQILLMLGLSLIVAFVASFIPVYRVSIKKPIEAIRKS